MSKVSRKIILALLLFATLHTSTIYAGAGVRRVRSMLLTAAYSTVIGAGVGLAVVAFTDKPSQNTHYIYRSAAVGLLAGVLVGAAISFAPLFFEDAEFSATTPAQRLDYLPDPQLTGSKMVISPIFRGTKLVEVAARVSLLQF